MLIHANSRVSHEDIRLSEIVNWAEEDKYSGAPRPQGPWSSGVHRDRKQKGVARGCREQGVGGSCLVGVELQACRSQSSLCTTMGV